MIGPSRGRLGVAEYRRGGSTFGVVRATRAEWDDCSTRCAVLVLATVAMIIRALRQRRWTAVLSQGLAIMLVAFALVDLGTQMPCCADELGLPFPHADAHAVVDPVHSHESAHASAPATDDSGPAHSDHGGGDCFCSAVAIPAVTMTVDVSLDRDPALGPTELSPLDPSLRAPYHPPRFA